MAIEGGGTITESFEMDFVMQKFDEALVKKTAGLVTPTKNINYLQKNSCSI